MKRLPVLLAVLLATWLGVAVPATAAVALPGNPGSMHGYIYDADHTLASSDNTATKRGPPMPDESGTTNDAVGRWPHGASLRPDGPTPREKTTYDTRATFAKATRVAGYDLEPRELAGGNVIAFARGGVAANTTAELSRPSSRVLGANLEAAGAVRPAGSAAHHIVAGSAARAAEARAVLQRYGIDINDAGNGVFLPARMTSPNPTGAAVHSTIHTNAYYAEVNSLLGQATTRGEALDALAYVRSQLLSGGFP